mgnify:CR=1 FL=1
MRATESFISIVLNHGLQVYGGDLYVGSMTVMQSVMQIFSAPIGGFTQGISPVISYNYGAGNFARVKEVYRWMIGACFLFMFLATVTTILFPEWYAFSVARMINGEIPREKMLKTIPFSSFRQSRRIFNEVFSRSS